jgi:hypothetical protein
MANTVTHKGWFGVCPVYLGDIESDSPFVVERLPIYYPLLVFSEAMYQVVMNFMEWMGQEPPGFPLVVGKRLDPPRQIDAAPEDR